MLTRLPWGARYFKTVRFSIRVGTPFGCENIYERQNRAYLAGMAQMCSHAEHGNDKNNNPKKRSWR